MKLDGYKKAMNTKEVRKGMVRFVQNGNTEMVLDLNGVKGIIPKEEVDLEMKWSSLVPFVGRQVNFIVTGVDEEAGIVYCSRKQAQEIIKPLIVERLTEGEVVSATITNILKYGAYVDIEDVSGLLKNVDFSLDHTSIGDVYKVGDKINVKLKKMSSSDKLIVEAITKYSSPTIMNFEMFSEDQVVFGKIRDVKPWGIFVCIAPGLDAMCQVPATGEFEEGMKVSFRITKVIPEEKRVRGKIVKALA